MIDSWHCTFELLTTLLPVCCASHCTTMSMFAPWKLTSTSSGSFFASALALSSLPGSVALPVVSGSVGGDADLFPSDGSFFSSLLGGSWASAEKDVYQ